VRDRKSTSRVSVPATVDSPIRRAQDEQDGVAAEPLRVLLVGSPDAAVVSPHGRRVEVVACAETPDQVAAMAELYRPDVILVAEHGRPKANWPGLVRAAIGLASLGDGRV
jgi:hypothetical protein